MQNFTAIWLLLGIILCLMELLLPTAFVQLLMGISGLLVAGLSLLGLSNLFLQVIVWLILSSFLTIFSRRFFTVRQTKSKILISTVGETMTEILPGKVGRVLYEGNSWRG
ncbi:NfeD family protein, partial [Cylindrospermopsis raciborskii]|uniref:NfeD family protein n=1 Tax=Cylindrospermopsis raciborskii TaxID=77022 RepID=UPI0038D06271